MRFPLTEWSLVLKASVDGSADGRSALDRLCRGYWAPVRDFLKGRGHSAEQAEDLTQEFFSGLLASEGWKRADPSRGKFRSFLLGVLMRDLSDARRKETAAKRGGHAALLNLDDLPEKEDPADAGEWERGFDQGWAAHVVNAALNDVAEAWMARGRAADFEVLIDFLPVGGGTPDTAAAADRLGLADGALRSAVFRIRAEFREAVQARIASTVTSPQELSEEMNHLCQIMMQPGFDAHFSVTSGVGRREKQV